MLTVGNLYFLQSAKTGIDIDFFLPDEGLAVQAAFSVEGEARERELKSLKKLSKMSEEIKRFLIITMEEEERIEMEDLEIEVLPAYKFLLSM